MASLTSIDRRILEDLLEMGEGYVLDFSNATYAEFFNDFGINIYDQRYQVYGDSKAKLMRGFWKVATDEKVGKVLDSLFRYVTETNSNNSNAKVEDKHIAIASRLLNRTKEKKTESYEHTEDDFLDIEYKNIDLSRLNLGAGLAETIKQRLDEIQLCLKSKSSLAVIFLCGSTLEGVLLNAATKNPKIFNTSKCAPQRESKVKQFHEWSLNELINVAHDVGLIGVDVKKFSHALRDFRNYIHPLEQASQGFNPDYHTAKISWQVLQAALANLAGKRNISG